MQTPLAPMFAVCLALAGGIFCPAAGARGTAPSRDDAASAPSAPSPKGAPQAPSAAPTPVAPSDDTKSLPSALPSPSSPPQTVSLPSELPPGTNEIRVSLFGQPCLLRGPLPAATLTAIHAVSPERIPAEIELADARAALERLREEPSLPQAFDRYRSRLLARVEAQVAFLAELGASARSGKDGALLSIARKHSPAARWRAQEPRLRELATSESLRDPERRAALTAAFLDAIEPHPEAEFHRVLPRVGAQYACNFDAAE
jgi:hypothetical protein